MGQPNCATCCNALGTNSMTKKRMHLWKGILQMPEAAATSRAPKQLETVRPTVPSRHVTRREAMCGWNLWSMQVPDNLQGRCWVSLAFCCNVNTYLFRSNV